MKHRLWLPCSLLLIVILSGFWYFSAFDADTLQVLAGYKLPDTDPDAIRSAGGYDQFQWEFDLMKDPRTGKLPLLQWSRQQLIASSIPSRYAFMRTGQENTYLDAGPDNQGGRTRCAAYDLRYNGSSNQVILAGGVSGGIFRSTDGGSHWTWVPTYLINSVTTLAQDPRSGHQDTWYCGTGEYIPTSFISGVNGDLSFIPGWGLFQSSDNGVSWQPMSFSNTQAPLNPDGTGRSPYQFDNAYDIINRIAVNPANGNLYVARYGSLIRVSPDLLVSGNYSREYSLGTYYGAGQNTLNQVNDVVCTSDGKTVYAAFDGQDTLTATINGGQSPDSHDLEGVWQGSVSSATGHITWTKIAGSDLPGPAGWPSSNSYGRIVLALAPSDNNTLYALMDNGKDGTSSASHPVPEADLFRYDALSHTWTDLSANLPASDATNRGAFQVQAGYDMALSVSPGNPQIVYLGGVNAYRSDDGFTSSTKTTLINGYAPSNQTGTFSYDNNIGHPDTHWFCFRPGNATEMIVCNDGGMQKTLDAGQADSVNWVSLSQGYQTLQYYYVTADPTSGAMTFAGGAQDNHCTLRNAFNADPNAHDIYQVGDGCSVGLSQVSGSSKYFYLSSQNGSSYRVQLNAIDNRFAGSFSAITPKNAMGNFITLFWLDPDNTENLYYASHDSLFSTTHASTVSPSDWNLLKGVSAGLGGDIRSMTTTRGPYSAGHNLFLGTDNGKIFRLSDPEHADSLSTAQDITPGGMQGVVIGLGVNPRHDDTLMAVVSSFNVPNIWWTGNANAARPVWQSCEGNLDSLSIRSCVIADEQGTVVYYVGTSSGLYSTDAIQGASTVWYHEGSGALSAAIVSSLSLRPSDNTMVVGTHGNGMFYTQLSTASTSAPPPPVISGTFVENVFPSLVLNTLHIQIGHLSGIQNMYVTLYNAIGQLVYRQEDPYSDQSVDLSRMAPGLYLLQLSDPSGEHSYLRKLLKQ